MISLGTGPAVGLTERFWNSQLSTLNFWASLMAQTVKNEGDLDSNPGSGKSPGEGNGHPLQYSGLENSVDRGAWQATVHGVAKELDKTERLSLHL